MSKDFEVQENAWFRVREEILERYDGNHARASQLNQYSNQSLLQAFLLTKKAITYTGKRKYFDSDLENPLLLWRSENLEDIKQSCRGILTEDCITTTKMVLEPRSLASLSIYYGLWVPKKTGYVEMPGSEPGCASVLKHHLQA